MTTNLAPLNASYAWIDPRSGKPTPQFSLWMNALVERAGGLTAFSNTELAGQVDGVSGGNASLLERVAELEDAVATLTAQVEVMGDGIAAELASLRYLADVRSRVQQLEDART